MVGFFVLCYITISNENIYHEYLRNAELGNIIGSSHKVIKID